MLRLESIHGPQVTPYLEALGELRITVFREFPYLYDGTLENEREYLQVYERCPRSLVVLAKDGDAVIGASTCMPMADEGPEVQEAFVRAGFDLAGICYFGESLLLPSYRGQGLGKEFFKRREAHARALGLRLATFCAVDRPEDHPRRPAGYRPLYAFWEAQGYTRQPELQARFSWKDLDEAEPSFKTLTFWTKLLD